MRNHSPNCSAIVIARHTRERGARSTKRFSMRSVLDGLSGFWALTAMALGSLLLCNVYVAYTITPAFKICNSNVARLVPDARSPRELTSARLGRFARVLGLACFIRRTARVHPLNFGDFLVVDRDGRTAVALFTDEVVTRGGDVTAQARHALEIDHLVPADLDPRGRRRRVGGKRSRELQREELPPVRRGKRCLGMLHHGLTRHQLQKGPDGVLGVRDSVPQDAYGFGESLEVCIPDVGVPDFRTFTDTAERLVGDRDVLLRLDEPGHDAE